EALPEHVRPRLGRASAQGRPGPCDPDRRASAGPHRRGEISGARGAVASHRSEPGPGPERFGTASRLDRGRVGGGDYAPSSAGAVAISFPLPTRGAHRRSPRRARSIYVNRSDLHGGHPVLEHMVAVPATRTGLWVAIQRATRSRYVAERVPSAGPPARAIT